MSNTLHTSLSRGLTALTGRRTVLKGASGLAIGSLGIGGLSGGDRSARAAPLAQDATPAASTASAPSVRFAELATLPFVDNYPTAETSQQLQDELLFQQGVQCYLWALPAINVWAMKEGSEKQFGAGYHVLPVWKQRMDAKTLVTTPNADVIYAMGYVDVGTDGPLVIEVPAKLQGILDDFWQRPVPGPTIDGVAFSGDVGFAGPDKGNGGKYLVLPPGYEGNVPDGYFVYRPSTNNVFVFWRAFFTDPTQLSDPVSLIEQTRIYPLGKETEAKPMQFPDASGVPVNMLFPADGSYFAMLSRFIESEVVVPADVDWRGMLAGIGIVKDQPFAPDERTAAILDAAAQTAFKTSKVLAFDVFPARADARVYPDRQWVNPYLSNYSKEGPQVDLEWLWHTGSFRDLDARVNFFTNYYSISPGMVRKTAGAGAAYVVGFRDRDGALFAPDKAYRLQLPAGVPAANFWSLSLYDALTASGLDNGQPFFSLSSFDQPVANADGSYDLYLGPTPPPGKEKNWKQTVPGKGYFVILRLYSPTEPFFDQTWRPGDIEEMR